MSLLLSVFSLCLSFFEGPAAGEQEFAPRPAIDALFAAWDRPDGPGGAVAVIEAGEVIYARGYGSAQLEDQTPITPRTVFHVASVSKQFTAFAVVLLATRGVVDLDADVRRYLPEMPDFGAPLTLRQLIHHTSGLRDQWDLLTMAGWRMDDVITHHDVLQLIVHQRELNFPPGERHSYCNTGYTLLAEVVSRVTGKSLREFAAEEMFAPLGMDQTHFHDDHQHLVPHRAYSYAAREGGGWQHSVLSYAIVGATSLFTTVLDLARWQENFALREIGGDAALEILLQRAVLNDGTEISYAGGLTHGTYRGLPTVSHSGGDAGFRSFLIRFPEQDFSVAVLGNAASFNPQRPAYEIADQFLEHEMAEAPKTTPTLAQMLSASAPNPAPVPALPTLAPDTLVGAYYSAELDLYYRILSDEGGLRLRLRHSLDQRLVPGNGGTFQTGLGELRFAPADATTPVQLFVSTGRSWNVRFSRCEDPRAAIRGVRDGSPTDPH